MSDPERGKEIFHLITESISPHPASLFLPSRPPLFHLDVPISFLCRQTALNPKGLVPALTYQGKPLHDSHVILEFLEDAYPQYEPHMIPTDPYQAAQARIWVDFVNKFIVHGYFRIFHAQTPEAQAPVLSEWIKYLQCYADKIRGPYFFGEEFSIVDLSVVSWVLRDWVLIEHRGFRREAVSPKFEAYCQTLAERPAIKKTLSVCLPFLYPLCSS